MWKCQGSVEHKVICDVFLYLIPLLNHSTSGWGWPSSSHFRERSTPAARSSSLGDFRLTAAPCPIPGNTQDRVRLTQRLTKVIGQILLQHPHPDLRSKIRHTCVYKNTDKQPHCGAYVIVFLFTSDSNPCTVRTFVIFFFKYLISNYHFKV